MKNNSIIEKLMENKKSVLVMTGVCIAGMLVTKALETNRLMKEASKVEEFEEEIENEEDSEIVTNEE